MAKTQPAPTVINIDKHGARFDPREKVITRTPETEAIFRALERVRRKHA